VTDTGAGRPGQPHAQFGAALLELVGAEHAAIEDRQGQPIDHRGPVRLQQIERQAGTAVAQAVKVADARVEAGGLEAARDLVAEEDVAEVQERIGGVVGWVLELAWTAWKTSKLSQPSATYTASTRPGSSPSRSRDVTRVDEERTPLLQDHVLS